YPQLVNRSMVDAIRPYSDGYVECVSELGIPQELWAADNVLDGARLEDGKLWNYYYPSPAMHMEAASALEPLCRRYLTPVLAPSDDSTKAPPPEKITEFVILSSERTGSDLLRGLLSSHPGCIVGHELFNEVYEQQGYIPWHIDPETGSH